jgi:hypothetical protein
VRATDETEKQLAVSAGLSREFGTRLSVGIEGLYRRDLAETGADPASLMLGPTINLQTEKIQFAFGWHPQVWGSPATNGSRNLTDFERHEVRFILGVGL